MALIHDDKRVDLKQRGQRIAYALHAFTSCVATDFIDPFVGALRQYSQKHGAPGWLQKPLKLFNKLTGWMHNKAHGDGHDHGHDHAHGEHCDHHHEHPPAPSFDHLQGWAKRWAQFRHFAKEGHLGHWLGAEAVGDVGGAASFVAISEWAPKWLDKFTRGFNSLPLVKPTVNWLAERTTRSWAKENQVAEGSEEYKQELSKWQEFQSQNFAYSALIAVLGTAQNLLAHKFIFKNPASLKNLFIGKVYGVLATNVLLMGSRLIAPRAVKSWEEGVSNRLIEPLLSKVSPALDARDARASEQAAPASDVSAPPHKPHSFAKKALDNKTKTEASAYLA